MTLEEHVREAWDNAFYGGYDTWLLETNTIDIAIDMMDCDSDVELYSNGIIQDVVGFIDVLQLKYKKEVYGDFPEDYHKLPFYNKNQRKKHKKNVGHKVNNDEGNDDA